VKLKGTLFIWGIGWGYGKVAMEWLLLGILKDGILGLSLES
jgi:hypothetical protein